MPATRTRRGDSKKPDTVAPKGSIGGGLEADETGEPAKKSTIRTKNHRRQSRCIDDAKVAEDVDEPREKGITAEADTVAQDKGTEPVESSDSDRAVCNSCGYASARQAFNCERCKANLCTSSRTRTSKLNATRWNNMDPLFSARSVFCARLPSERQKEQAKRIASKKAELNSDSDAEEITPGSKRSRVTPQKDPSAEKVAKRTKGSSRNHSKAGDVAVKGEADTAENDDDTEQTVLRVLTGASLSPKLEVEGKLDAKIDLANSACVNTDSENDTPALDQISKDASAGFNVSLDSEVGAYASKPALMSEVNSLPQDAQQESEAEAQASLLGDSLGLAAALGALAQVTGEATVSESGGINKFAVKRTWKGWNPEEVSALHYVHCTHSLCHWTTLSFTESDCALLYLYVTVRASIQHSILCTPHLSL